MRFIVVLLYLLFIQFTLAQEDTVEGWYADPSVETQYAFVQELLYVAGYVPEQIEIYQTLPNYAHVYRVKLDSLTGGFMFVRWDKNKKEHFLDNKKINPGLYYNLNVARELMRSQAQKTFFTTEDIAIQASDQKKINTQDILEIRESFELKEEEKRVEALELKKIQKQKEQRKIERKSKRKKKLNRNR